MRKLILVVVLFTIVLVGPAHATFFETGASLIQGWREHQKIMQSQPGEKNYLLASQFVGYVTGVIDAQAENLRIPVGATKDQVCAIVGKYLEAHPEEWNKVGSDLVVKALRIAFSQRQ